MKKSATPKGAQAAYGKLQAVAHRTTLLLKRQLGALRVTAAPSPTTTSKWRAAADLKTMHPQSDFRLIALAAITGKSASPTNARLALAPCESSSRTHQGLLPGFIRPRLPGPCHYPKAG
ncbi:hypothetical protein BESB_036330 [Besnoitia besnoiti]|uniref:Uncharacterized protein n=1 Tax=Besnoitia besnoiti TaxID=94643 RepID=A0A2A9MGS1_BESBE|nr:hypothetical protein BESB_036330 [Besnoitia besnoiti]PFH37175.1 hypothetical protein BESB_036330 [Besnoitia besnoiti]